MPRYLDIWEIDMTKVPTDPDERMALVTKMHDMTKQWLKEHPGSQWGISLDGTEGFALSSARAKWQDIAAVAAVFQPYIKSRIFQVMSAEEIEEVRNSMMPKK